MSNRLVEMFQALQSAVLGLLDRQMKIDEIVKSNITLNSENVDLKQALASALSNDAANAETIALAIAEANSAKTAQADAELKYAELQASAEQVEAVRDGIANLLKQVQAA
jgi:regulator of replication initiation timing